MARVGLRTVILLVMLLSSPRFAVGVGEAPVLDTNAPLPLNLSQEGAGELDSYSAVSREMLTKTLLALALVLGLGLGVAWVTKRLLPRLGVNAGKDIRVLETIGLGPRKALHLVQVGSQQLLIGSTPEQISMLTIVKTGFDEVIAARMDAGEAS